MSPADQSNDNVVPFPLPSPVPDQAASEDPRELARRLADQVLSSGQDPRELLTTIFGAGVSQVGWDLPVRRQPQPGPRRAQAATYQVRVDLDQAKPPIWRRLALASDLTLDQVHEVLQAAMGWTDSHLHNFTMGPVRDHELMPFLTDFDVEEGDEGLLERDVRLDQVLTDVGDRLFYDYDFGDGWSHTIKLEKVTAYDDTTPRAACLAGRRACPPEDCGGMWGYTELLAALADPDAADEHLRERLDWLPEGFDPAEFSVTEADQLVRLADEESPPRLQRLAEPLVDLVVRSGPVWRPLAALIAAADLDTPDLPDEAARERMVRPWLRLIESVGEDGIQLTAAGYLPPAIVNQLATELELVEPWMGKANRENHFPPIAWLRASASAMGLVRKLKGRLVLAPQGRRLAGDADAMWSHLATALPLGSNLYERHAGAIALCGLAAGEAPRTAVGRHGPPLLSCAGWALDGGIDEWDARAWARPTVDALDLAGGTLDPLCEDAASDAGRQLARAALRAPD